jgi:Galactose-3-O-sulfotransferase
VVFCEDLIEQSPRPGEQRNDHIFFLKMHKCGSSTVQNILMRTGYTRKLNFVLSAKGMFEIFFGAL